MITCQRGKKCYQCTSLEAECRIAGCTQNNHSGQQHRKSGWHSLEDAKNNLKAAWV